MTTTATRRTRKTASSKAAGSLNLATGELKVGPAKKTAAKKTTAKKAVPAHVRKQAKEMEALEASGKPKSEQTFEERDWTYLDEKDPSEQHVLLAKEINRRTNETEINAKQVQAVLAMFPHFQRSDTNKNRSQYRPLADEIVHQRSVHMKLAHQEAREIMDVLAATATKKAAKAPAKKAATKKAPAKPATKKATPAKKTAARVTKRTPAIPAPAAAEAF
jgi:hypothetical protein